MYYVQSWSFKNTATNIPFQNNSCFISHLHLVKLLLISLIELEVATWQYIYWFSKIYDICIFFT